MSKDHYKLNRDTYNSLAEQYQEKFMDWDGYHNTYDTFLATLSPDVKVVDDGNSPLRGLTSNFDGSSFNEYSLCKVDIAKSGVDGVAPLSNDKEEPSFSNLFTNEFSDIFLIFINY